jgi:AraC family L-rhamnose operon regulatory protein RhaS
VSSGTYPPIYSDESGRYRADSCVPLNQAIARGDVEFSALARGQYPGRRLRTGQLPGLKTAGYWDASQRQQWGLDWHRNEGIELTYCESGRLSFSVHAQSWELGDGDLAVTRPWQLHRLGDPCVTAGRLHWIILDVGVRRPNQSWSWPRWLVLQPEDLDELARRIRQNEQCVWRADHLRQHFVRIAQATQEATPHALSRIAVAVNDLLLLVLDMVRTSAEPASSAPSDSRRTVDLFLHDLATNSNAFSREWSVEEMARSCGLAKTQFLKYCRQITNMSPAQYLKQCRLEAAAQRIRERSATPLTQIALQCGFTSSQYFATVFQQRFGCTPSAYRRTTSRNEVRRRATGARRSLGRD